MKLIMKTALLCLFVLGCTVLLAGCGDTTSDELDEDDIVTSGWWSIPIETFIADYKDLATGNAEQRSRFAWMLFARLNQPIPESAGADTFTVWELWASDPNTFVGDPPPGAPGDRTAPHITPSAKSQLQPGEEKTRNSHSWDYIVKNTARKLYILSEVETILGTSGGKIEFPVGSIEIKALWDNTIPVDTGIYQISDSPALYSLRGLHIMTKIALAADPVTDDSWFWTTFEYMNNPGYDHAMTLITPSARDSLPASDRTALLKEAGLDKLPWTNYRLNGTQIDFMDGTTPIILGNTTMEAGFAFSTGNVNPPVGTPNDWIKWESSCHSCHYTASGTGSSVASCCPGPPYPTGNVTLSPAGAKTIDFEWAIPFHAQH